jgi:phospholipase/carboxylesterase
MDINRRRFATIAGGAFASAAFGDACRLESEPAPGNDGRLSARPRADAATSAKGGALGLDRGRDGILHLPADAARAPLPLLVLLHGAGGSGEGILRRLGAAADDAGVAVLAPDSRGSTWDAIRDGFGPDVTFLNRALERVFDTVAIDPARVAVGGFSDGATYALSLGLINGDLFRRVVAFSPGFIIQGDASGKPRLFISHGRADRILPIDQCSRVIVRQLRPRGYDITFREFDGGHEMPEGVVTDAMRWVAAPK